MAAFFSCRYCAEPGWLLVSLAAAYALLVLSFIDMDHMIIPDELSLGLVGLGLATCWLNPYFADGRWRGFAPSLGGALTGLLLLWGIAWFGELVFKKEAMGGGDVKLMAGVGALLGWQGVLSTLMMGSFFGAVYGLVLMLQKRVGGKDPIPFGPFLSLAALINLYHLVLPSAFMIG
jgi:leader peptidase (prepilin peptidase)/N-methyltransferase